MVACYKLALIVSHSVGMKYPISLRIEEMLEHVGGEGGAVISEEIGDRPAIAISACTLPIYRVCKR